MSAPRRVPCLLALAALVLAGVPSARAVASAGAYAAARAHPAVARAHLAVARAHPGPPLYLQIDIRPDRLEITLTVEQWTLFPWLGRDPDVTFETALPAGEAERLAAETDRFLAEHNRFTVDGEPVVPRTALVEVLPPFSNGLGGPGMRVVARVDISRAPERVGVRWERFDGVDGGAGFGPPSEPQIPLLFRAEGEFDLLDLAPSEPEAFWHTRERAPRERPAAQTGAPQRPRMDLPLVSLALLGVGVVGLSLLRARGARPTVAWGFATAALAGMLLTRNVARVAVPSPFPPRVTMPAPSQARAMFETLHLNVYAAFEATSEEEIYDLLAVSVAPHLLDELYGEVYESLILRSEGGAVCRIEDVRVLAGEIDLNPAAPDDATADAARALEFTADWSWEVEGLVAHFGHVHRRTNRYRARYTVRHDGLSWKIADVETLEHVRVEDDGEEVRMQGFDTSIDDLVPPRRPRPEDDEDGEEDAERDGGPDAAREGGSDAARDAGPDAARDAAGAAGGGEGSGR